MAFHIRTPIDPTATLEQNEVSHERSDYSVSSNWSCTTDFSSLKLLTLIEGGGQRHPLEPISAVGPEAPAGYGHGF